MPTYYTLYRLSYVYDKNTVKIASDKHILTV